MMIERVRWLLILILLSAASGGSLAAAGSVQPADLDLHPDATVATAAVEVDGRVLFRVRGVSSFPARERAAAITERIKRLAGDPALPADSVRLVESGGYSSIMAGDRRIMALFDSDARIEEVARETLGLALCERIGKAIDEYRHDRDTQVLQRRGLEAAGATAALATMVTLLLWLARQLNGLLERRFRSRIHHLGIQSFEIVRAESIWAGLRAALSALRMLSILIVSFIYLDFVLSRFPWTRWLAGNLTDFALRPLRLIGEGLIGYFPDLIFLIVLALLVRFVLRLLRLFFDAVAQGSVTLLHFEAEWARPTYKIARFALLVLAVIVAYPYIPGSESAAFKGVTLMLGVVVSLGSSSIIANLIAGLMITYRRAFRVGDRVRIGEVTGDVTQVRLQVTHLRTLKNEEVTIPNSQILNGHVMNYSSLAKKQGLILHATVGIGYETPWRQVEAMLLQAAARTPGLLAEPTPFVMHKELGDFCVSYEINAYCNDARMMEHLYTELRRNILDLFNEYDVQIMTPAYEGDPKQPKVVPRDQWYAAPAVSGPVDDAPATASGTQRPPGKGRPASAPHRPARQLRSIACRLRSSRPTIRSAGFVGRVENDPRSLAGLQGFAPTRGTQAPAVAGFEAGKTELRPRRRQIVATRTFENSEEVGGQQHANGVAAEVLVAGRCSNRPEKIRSSASRCTEPSRPSEHVALHCRPYVVGFHASSSIQACWIASRIFSPQCSEIIVKAGQGQHPVHQVDKVDLHRVDSGMRFGKFDG
jgi:small-conductance mechanosensitive channel